MNAFATVLLLVVAVIASGLAAAAGTNEALALGAATVAVLAGALLLFGVVERTRWPPGRPLPPLPADPARVRSSFEAGTRGRPALVELLDNLDRHVGNLNRARTTIEELARLQALDRDEFREYLVARVTDLEGRA